MSNVQIIKREMEIIRMNPRKYFRENIEAFNDLTKIGAQGLLKLLFSCIGYGTEFKFAFIKVANVLNQGKLQDLSEVGWIYYYNIMALHERYNEMIDLSQALYLESHKRAVDLGDNELAARALIGVATCLDMKGNADEALEVMKNVLKMTPKIYDHSVLGDVFANYAKIKNATKDFDGILMAYETAGNHFRQVENYMEYINYCVYLGNVAIFMIDLGKKDEADRYITEMLSLYDEDDFLLLTQGAVRVVSDYYASRRSYKKIYELNKRLIQAQQKERLMLYSINKDIDVETVSHIANIEALKNKYKVLELENALLHEQIINNQNTGLNQSINIINAVSEGIRNNEFVPYFQGVIDTTNLKLKGYEVLARWRKAPDNILSPFHFIEQIEDTPLISEMSEQIIRKALNEVSKYKGADTNFTIAFNIAPYQLIHQNLRAFLDAICVEYNISKDRIVLEITERSFINNNGVAIDQLHNLKRAGYKLALDDFGSGYASLSTISALPLDIVKFDRSLLNNVLTDEKASQLYKGIVYLISTLGMIGVSEGIETQEEFEFMKEINCNRVQGYLFHYPQDSLICY